MDYYIPLTEGFVTRVSEEDYEYLLRWNWHYKTNGQNYCFARTTFWVDGKCKEHRMHRLILSRKLGRALKRSELPDHEDGDSLNNTRTNIRLASYAQNSFNAKKQANRSSIYKGVIWREKPKKWHAQIRFQRKLYFLGSFSNEVEAALTYDKAARHYHGEFARLNFP